MTGVQTCALPILLDEARAISGLPIITEVMEPGTVDVVQRYADVLQIGARNCQNYPLLREVGKARKPVMLKRNPGATLQEWASAAEYLLKEGNRRVILCERGVRGLESELRYTLDLAGAAFMQHRYSLPVVIDPSHATGVKQILEACTTGALAMGFAGVMLETHPRPVEARSDANQALTPEEFSAICRRHLTL